MVSVKAKSPEFSVSVPWRVVVNVGGDTVGVFMAKTEEDAKAAAVLWMGFDVYDGLVEATPVGQEVLVAWRHTPVGRTE